MNLTDQYNFDGTVKVMNVVQYDSKNTVIARQSQAFVTAPEPGTLLLMGSVFLGLATVNRKKLFKKT